jgi:hypothetical protein
MVSCCSKVGYPRNPSERDKVLMKMNVKICGIAVLVLGAFLVATFSLAEHHNDTDAIKQAVQNYARAIYEVDPKLIDKSVHPRLQKVGYAPKNEGDGYREMWMTFDELKELTRHWNKDGHMDAATAKLEVKILDQLDKTAVVRLDAEWGIDFIHLAKEGDKWMIMNVIWQTYPAE